MLTWQPGIKLSDLKKEAVKQALIYHKGNITKAAKDLGMGKSTFYGLLYTIFTPAEVREMKPVKEWWK